MNRLIPLAVAALPALAGCASDPAPREQIRLTGQVIAQARAVGATEQIAEMALAERKLDEAEAAMSDGEHRLARLLAEQAELDARLAEVRVLSDRRLEQLQDTSRRIERLRRQLEEAP